jgi:hypothetical protein
MSRGDQAFLAASTERTPASTTRLVIELAQKVIKLRQTHPKAPDQLIFILPHNLALQLRRIHVPAVIQGQDRDGVVDFQLVLALAAEHSTLACVAQFMVLQQAYSEFCSVYCRSTQELTLNSLQGSSECDFDVADVDVVHGEDFYSTGGL